MAISLIDIVDGAKFRADLTNADRVSEPEWTALVNEAIQHAWRLAHSARPDFQVSSQDFTVTSGQSASFTAPSNMFGLIDVVANPDTANEFSLGPFAWQNRRSPGSWGPPVFQAQGAQRARLMGNSIYLEPATSAGGIYRCWFCPKPTTLVAPDFKVRVASPGADIMAAAYTASGAGSGKSLTSTAPGTQLSVDGVPLGVDDRFLLKNATNANDNGIYSVTQQASAGVPWIATRATDYDSNDKIKLGKVVSVSEGLTLLGTFFSLTSFSASGIDAGAMTFSSAASIAGTLDPILDPFVELLRVKTALPAVLRDDDLNPTRLQEDLQRLEIEMANYFLAQRSNNGPEKMVDTDARGPARWGTW